MSNMQQLAASMPKETFELFHDGLMLLDDISRWTLVGGTALAIHYQHRLSEDLDFFIKNSTLEQDRKRIDKMVQKLEEDGFSVTKLFDEDRQIDFEISGVKVTFFASSLKILQKDNLQYGAVEVAGIETIKAMKMDAILNYRTLTRDFYDIATITNKEKITIFDMLESYRQHYDKKLSSSHILDRLTKREFDKTDPGLSEMQPKKTINPSSFRKELGKQIQVQTENDTKSINTIINNPSIIKKYIDRKFGLTRMNLPQKLASIGEDDLVLKALKFGGFDITYKDISGKSILDYYLDNEKIFSEILSYAEKIPDKWLQSRQFKQHGKDRLIALENSVISCAKNKNNSNEKIERIANKHGLEPKKLQGKIQKKEKLLKSFLSQGKGLGLN